jgi:hypothetical protein
MECTNMECMPYDPIRTRFSHVCPFSLSREPARSREDAEFNNLRVDNLKFLNIHGFLLGTDDYACAWKSALTEPFCFEDIPETVRE